MNVHTIGYGLNLQMALSGHYVGTQSQVRLSRIEIGYTFPFILTQMKTEKDLKFATISIVSLFIPRWLALLTQILLNSFA